MNNYGRVSLGHFVKLRPNMQLGLKELLKYMDHSLICSLRNEENQNRMFEEGNSELKFPESRHNYSRDPSLSEEDKWLYSDAVDIIPYPGGHEDIASLLVMMGRLIQIFESKGMKVTWGGDWDRDGVLNNSKGEFFDGFHIQMEYD